MFFSWQTNGHSVWLQIHRDVGDHQLQCGRITSRHTDPDTIEVGPTTGTWSDQVFINAQTLQVTVGKLRANIQEIQGIPNVYQPPGEGTVKQGVGQRFQVEVVWKPTRALMTNSEKKKMIIFYYLGTFCIFHIIVFLQNKKPPLRNISLQPPQNDQIPIGVYRILIVFHIIM